jgi:hypothetical protein
MSRMDVGVDGCTVGGDLLGVSGPQNQMFLSIWVAKRLRNGSRTARDTAEFWPSPRPALLLKVINDRGELHFLRTRHRGASQPCRCQGAPRAAVSLDALPIKKYTY